ncbi:MAG: carbohydrate ABC transporter permease [Eubacteriales bacterium]|nr:carbohydrate ABC transporter permease [Eubacteriales bacterium]
MSSKPKKRIKEKKENIDEESDSRFNRVSKKANIGISILFFLLAASCVIPFILVVIISFTSEQSLQMNGYSFWPEEWSIESYKYILSSGTEILRAYGVTILVTVLGTLLGLFIMATYGYALSRKTFAYRGFFTKLIFIPMLFSGGMVASYLVMVNFLHLKDSILALILPLSVSSFNIIILRTFFRTSVPDAVIESARIDGASEMKLFIRIVLPIAIPGIATIGLFLTLAYWNDWFNAMLYIENPKLVPVQYMLIKMEKSMEFLISNATLMGTNAIEAASKMPKETVKMAIVVITTLPIMFAYPFFQKYFVNGLTIGAVKE